MNTNSPKMTEPSSAPGAAIYSRPILYFYDWWVLGMTNTFGWRCSTTKVQLPFFKKYLSNNHLDIGVGTGYYLANSNLGPENKVTLLDLNRNSLNTANARIGGIATTIEGDALAPLKVETNFDSVSVFYLLHCMPGPLSHKAKLFANISSYISENGVLYGTTVLGKGVKHNLMGKTFMWLYNRMGTFGNLGDEREGIEEALRERFESVECWVQGVVLGFVARGPRRVRVDGVNGGGRRSVEG